MASVAFFTMFVTAWESSRRSNLAAIGRSEGDEVMIDVSDTGKGFPAEGRQRLLEPYMTTREGGTGLGLAIVGKILEDHGGGIDLLDNPAGRGGLVRMRIKQNLDATPNVSATVKAQRVPA